METSILHKKIERYKKDSPSKFGSELASDFESWALALDKWLGEVSWQELTLNEVILKQGELIEFMVKLLVISGNSDKLTAMRIMDKEILNDAVEFLFKIKDRSNHTNIHSIGLLLNLAKKDGKNITNLVELVKYARTGE